MRSSSDLGGRTAPSFCRICLNGCPILVELDGAGRARSVTGDDRSPGPYLGFTCSKGRAQPSYLDHPDRLLRSLKRTPGGDFEPIGIGQAIEEIAQRLLAIRRNGGPRAIASYWGTMAVRSALTTPVLEAFMAGLGSPMRFNPNTIDKPGKGIARALHGTWGAPPQGFDRPDVALLVGMNPLISFQGMPSGNPAKWLAGSLADGMKLIVIDPRRTEVARRASIHLQARPGTDVALLAAILRVIIEEDLLDRSFVDQHTTGLGLLRDALVPFTPSAVARRADVPADALVEAARTFATAPRGYAIAGTGPSMAGYGTLVEYLMLDLNTLCGRWLRAGERVRNPGTLRPSTRAVAQADPPRPVRGGAALRVRGFVESVAGMPTSALAEEMTLPGEGQVRALLSCGGNPVAAWPDQENTVEALEQLELLVHVDPWMSQTSQLADYVIAPTMPLEVEDVTLIPDTMQQPHVGTVDCWAQHTAAVVARPTGSDLIEEWQFFHRLAARMDVPLVIDRQSIGSVEPFALDVVVEPTSRQLLELLTRQARIPLAEVEVHPHGVEAPEPQVVVEPADPGHTGRLELADLTMLADLRAHGPRSNDTRGGDDLDLPYRLVCRRTPVAYNSSCIDRSTHRGRIYNPAFLAPPDLASLGLEAGDVVRITSRRGSVEAIVEPDPSLRRGLVSMAHCYGDGTATGRPEAVGTNTNRLISVLDLADPISGQPRMSDLPVRIDPVRAKHR